MVERGRTKCAQYWGPEPGDEVQAGGYTVTTLEVDTNPDYTVSILLLTNNKVHILSDLIALAVLLHLHCIVCSNTTTSFRSRLMRREKFAICCTQRGRIMVFLSQLRLYYNSYR